MSAPSNAFLRSLLARLPAAERSEAIKDATDSIDSDGASDISSLISLLADFPNEGARQRLKDRLLALLEAGDVETVVQHSAGDAELQAELFDAASHRLYAIASNPQPGLANEVAISIGHLADLSLDEDVCPAPGALTHLDKAAPLLRYANHFASSQRRDTTQRRVFRAALVLICSSNKDVSSTAVTFLAKSVSDGAATDTDLSLVWQSTKIMILSTDGSRSADLAYGLWVRLAASSKPIPQHWFRDSYWVLLRNGLRDGDGERRKQCLAILRRSVQIAVQDELTRHALCPHRGALPDRDAICDQFERFCTIFETILLGRYLNQVIACEGELNVLASPISIVHPVWVYTLLAASLHPKIQDSIRRFIGNWIMRSDFQPDDSSDFIDFFRAAFLPWATQGSLYTATLGRQNGIMRCLHGEWVAEYITKTLERNSTYATITSQLVDAVLSMLAGRNGGSFAYASVYLLEGIARAYENKKAIQLLPGQLSKLAEVSSSTALPEVARDFVFVRCIKLCGDSTFRQTEGLFGSKAVVHAIRRWNRLDAELRGERSAPARGQYEPIATWEAEPSNRDILEQQTLEKCKDLRGRFEEGVLPFDEPLQAILEDIWSDLEYLEYPKRLLLELPGVLLHRRLVQRVLLPSTSQNLKSIVPHLLQKLQKLSENRAYLLSPLMLALRDSMLAKPELAELLVLEEYIETYSIRLPEVTVDLQLEDATAQLLQSIAPTLDTFGYEYYFGGRGSIGIAALLDLVSRLGASNMGVVRSLFDSVLQRWARQKSQGQKSQVATISAWKSTFQLQLMVVCSEQISPQLMASEVQSRLKDLHYVLSIEPLPRYRYMLSWILARIYLKNQVLRSQVLGELRSKDHHSNPKYLASLMKLGVMLAKTEGADAGFAAGLATAFVPLSASSKVVIRHEAQWQVPQLMDHARAQKWSEITNDSSFAALDEYIRSLPRFDEPPLERQLDRFDPVKDHTMTNLVEGLWCGLDSTEAPLCGRADFVRLFEIGTGFRRMLPDSCMPLGDSITALKAQPTDSNQYDTASSVADTAALAPSEAGGSRALQTKGTAYLASGLDDLGEQEADRNELIVVASLVENPYNLGGLSRVAEIFGAAELHLQNQNVTSNKDFTNVSVSSHLHFPIHQLSALVVPTYLSEKKSEGWTIVGIEQTDRSLILGSEQCKLPEKIVLVIGSEKEGIPALVLGGCDLLVEIPQQGITRSLNVQTAAAIVLFEYTRQHKPSSR